MASAQSSALRSVPGYVYRAPTTAAYPTAPTVAMPSLPTVPQIDDARAPNAAGRSWLATQIAAMPGALNPTLTALQSQARAALTGYGGVTFRSDDPSTPQREDLLPSFDPNAKLGQREKNAVDAERWAANATGDMNSSFANKNVGAALTRLNEEKRSIVANFSTQISSAIQQQADRTTSLISDWTRLYGEDSAWLVDHPVLPPPPAPPAPAPAPTPAAPAFAPGTLASPNSGAGSFPTWTGSAAPNFQTLARAWGVPVSAIRLTKDPRTGKFTAWPQAAPPGGPGAGAWG